MDLQDLYQELIIDHGTKPRNCCALSSSNAEAQGYNPLCGDNIHLYLLIQNQIIEKATFTGSGCAISMASASLMTEYLTGKTTTEVLTIAEAFKETLIKDMPNTNENLGKLNALFGVKAYPSRVKCATLAWHTLETAIQNETQVVCTENLTPTVE